jgi:hypothetical protein
MSERIAMVREKRWKQSGRAREMSRERNRNLKKMRMATKAKTSKQKVLQATKEAA